LSALRAYPVSPAASAWTGGSCIASRKAIDHHRSRARSAPRRPNRPSGATTVDPTPDDALWDAVRTLPPRQRVAVVHRHVLDRSYPEIAELMGSTEEAARANVSQGIKKLRELIR
jgi:RNA polymerase sigma factor (sigma-70 family)